MNLFKDFEDFINLLQKHKVEYLIVGGYAVGIHSQPRATQDIDIWIKPTNENAEKLLSVFNEFGTPDLDLSINDIIKPDIVVHFGNPPLRIDILASIDGIEFDDAFKNKFIHDLGTIKNVYFISFKDLLKNKRASNRKKDNFDIQWLKDYGKDSKEI